MPATTTNPADLTRLLSERSIRLGVQAENKAELIKELVGRLPFAAAVDRSQIANAVLEREALLSTGVGHGVALPHAKSPDVEHTVAVLATTAEPLDFEAFDEKPVQIVFLMVGPERDSRAHLRVLGRISRILNDGDTRQRILAAKSSASVVETLRAAEATLKAG